MVTIRGTYDGKRFQALPTESVPSVDHEVPVAITFLEHVGGNGERRRHQAEIAKRMQAARKTMPVLKESVKELVEEGRER